MTNSLLNEHHTEAAVIHCIDFRFHEAIRDFLVSELGLNSFDLIAIPGAAKHLTAAGDPERQSGLLEDVGISIRLHDPKKIIFINHADCGAYGGRASFASVEEEEANHRRALAEAKEVLEIAFPGREVLTLLATIQDGNIVIS